MTDAQFTALIAAITTSVGIIGGIVKWIVSSWTKDANERNAALIKSQDAAAAAAVKSQDHATSAIIANTASNSTLSAKVDTLVTSNAELGRKLEAISDWVEEHTPVNAQMPERPQTRLSTPARGSAFVEVARRGRTHGDGDR